MGVRQPVGEQTCPDCAQSVPPGSVPDPVALHVVNTCPTHVGWFGVHARATQLVVVGSQYSVAVHCFDVLDPVPSAMQIMTRLPLQESSPGVQTIGLQLPAEQTAELSEQSVPPGRKPEPSALH